MNYSETKVIIDLSEAQNISELGLKITNTLDSEKNVNKDLFLDLGSINLKQSQLLSIKALIEAMQSKLAGIKTTSEMTETAAIGLGLIVGDISEDTRPSFNETFKTNAHETAETGDEITSFSQLKQNSLGDTISDTNGLPEVESENLKEETEKFLDNVDNDYEETSYDDNIETISSDDISDEVLENDKNTSSESNISDIDRQPTKEEEIQSALDITFGVGNIGNESVRNILNYSTDVEKKPSEPIKNVVSDEYEVTETVEKADDGKYVLLDTEGITPEGIELIKSNTSDLPTLYLTQTLRSGQTVSYEGNIFLIGDSHPGSEIIATGDITIWGILGGIVHAGNKGNTEAKVRALKLNPIQLRIANLYSRRNDTVNVPYVQKTNEFTPEEARIENDQIVIYKTLRRED